MRLHITAGVVRNGTYYMCGLLMAGVLSVSLNRSHERAERTSAEEEAAVQVKPGAVKLIFNPVMLRYLSQS